MLRRPAHKRPVTKGVAITLGAIITALLVGMGAAFGYFLTTNSAKPAVATAATLSPPTNAHVTAKTTTSVSLSWTLPSSQLTGAKYEVTRTSTTNVVCTVTAPSHTCTNTGLVPGTTYSYSVVAFLPSTSWTSSASTTSAKTTLATVVIATQTSATSVTVGQSVHDTATLSGGYSPTGTITWHVYLSSTATCSTAQGTYVSTEPVSGTTYASGTFTPTAVASYKWGFTYTGDPHNKAITHTAGCGGSTEAFSSVKATPTLSTSAGSSVSVDNPVHDTATVSGGYNPTGTVTFRLFKTSTCTNEVGTAVTGALSGGTVRSPTITPTTAGTYYWTASYTGNTNNNSVSEACGGTSESVVVTARTLTITTTTSKTSLSAGGSVTDTAHISGGYNPTGTLTWHVYSSTTGTCASPLLSYTGAQAVNGTGPYSPTTPLAASTVGAYKWGVTYAPGATANNAAQTLCGGSHETFAVTKASPTLSTAASTTGKTGTAIVPSSTLATGAGPTGTITWKVFKSTSAPTSCTGAGTTWTTGNTATVGGNGTYNPTTGFTPKTTGTYWWYATYGGDGNNSGATSLCHTASMAHTVISKATPTLTVGAPATDTTNTAIASSTISATLTSTSGTNAAGTITWRVFGPQTSAPTSCTSGYKSWTSDTATVSGTTVTYHPGAGYTPTTAGDYWWYASYGGDTNNTSTASKCGTGMTETVVATPTPVTVSQTVTSASTTGSTTATLSSAPSSGSTLLILIYEKGSGSVTPSISKTASGTAISTTSTLVTTAVPGTGYKEWAYWAKANGTGTKVAVTMTGASYFHLDVLQLAGNNTTSPIAQSKKNNSTSSSKTAVALLTSTPARGDAEFVLIGANSDYRTVGAPSTWTLISHANSFGSGYGEASFWTNKKASTSTSFTGNSTTSWATIAVDVAHA